MTGENIFDADSATPQTDYDDIILSPGGNTPQNNGVEAKINAVVFDRPHDTFKLPSGRELYIYSKSEGQLRLIDLAFQEWMDAERRGSRRIARRWRFWRLRRNRVYKALTEAQRAKYAFYRRVFEDQYNTDKHQEIAVEEFLSMGTDLQVAILDAHRRANDPTDILAALLGADAVKKNNATQQARPSGMLT